MTMIAMIVAPMSALTTVLPLSAFGISFNIMILGGIAAAIGLGPARHAGRDRVDGAPRRSIPDAGGLGGNSIAGHVRALTNPPDQSG